MAVVSRFPRTPEVSDGFNAVFAQVPGLHGAGALRDASVIAVEAMFADLEVPQQQRPNTVTDLALDALGFLPERYADRYDVRFARRFLLVLSDVTRRLTVGWEPLAAVAKELALSVVFSYTEAVIDTDELDVADGWRADLEQFEDLDFELLHEEDDAFATAVDRLGAANLALEEWFTPFRQPYAAPYVGDAYDGVSGA